LAKKEVALDVDSQHNRDELQAGVAIVTTGFGSQLVDKLGLGGADDFVMGAQAEVVTENISEVEVYFGSRIAPGSFRGSSLLLKTERWSDYCPGDIRRLICAASCHDWPSRAKSLPPMCL